MIYQLLNYVYNEQKDALQPRQHDRGGGGSQQTVKD